ncbi:MAG: deoxyribose-phosphate aldolase [Ignavibacteriales bacterium]
MDIAGHIDSTLLRPDAAREEVIELCSEAVDMGYAAVCVNPGRLVLAVECLAGSSVAPCTVVGFPLGAHDTTQKLVEVEWALEHGAREIDMVMNIGAFKDQEYISVAEEIRLASLKVKQFPGAVLKVIVETALLDREELRRAAIVVKDGGADYIKTSTGFSSRGVNLEDLQCIRETVGDGLKIKASGGIKTRDFALRLIKAGADRIGTSSARDIMKEWESEEA